MSDSKKFTPREAALAVIEKAKSLYQTSALSKAETKHDRCVEHVKENSPEVKNPHAVCVAEGVKPGMGKSDANPDEKEDAKLGEQVETAVHTHEATAEHPGQHDEEAGMKGHIKLAKFMGRMEHKKSQKSKEMDKSETGHEKGVNTASYPGEAPGESKAGTHIRSGNIGAGYAKPTESNLGNAKVYHKETLEQMQAMPKPKLPG